MPTGKATTRKRANRSVELEQPDQQKLDDRREITGLSYYRRALHVLVQAVLLTIVAAPSLLPKFSVVDNDIWWHLKVGDWMVEHLAVPRHRVLSRTAADQAWMAYSWIYEVLLSFFHSRFHLIGIGVYGLFLTLAVSYTVSWMMRAFDGTHNF